MSTDGLERAFAAARNSLSNVGEEQLDGPTPCDTWDVRSLVNHVVGGSYWFAASTEAGSSPDEIEAQQTDFTGGDYMASYDEGTTQAVAAFGAPGAMEKTVKLPFGEFPGEVFMGFATIDQFTHAWDLAKATGQSTDLDPEFAEQLLAQSQLAITDALRGPEGEAAFGPAVEVPGSAPAADRLAGFLGRQP